MKISKRSGSGKEKYNVLIIGEKGTVNTKLVKKADITKFRKSEKDIEQITDLNGALFLVKRNKDAEKMRKFGSDIRSKIEKDATSIYIHGERNDVRDLLEGFLLASYQFLKYFKDKEKRSFKMKEIVVDSKLSEKSLKELEDIYTAVSWTRDMVNEPVSFLSAGQFAEEMLSISEAAGISTKVLEKTQIESLKMGGLLAVNQGSIDEPTFTIMEYKPKGHKNKKPVVFVGKGVVYDTGGLSLKPTPHSMDIMKCDMGGGAMVAGAVYLAALQKLPVHIVALIPATDNRPGLNAYAPGDVVTMFDGTTVEVLNTDAEGRMILADALAYSSKFDPELVIDAATLTGAAERAIGRHASIMMGNANDKWFDRLEASGHETFERVVRFPFWEEYFEDMKSSIADLKNIGGATAGMITAGKFLEHFVKSPYIHIDIAGPSWLDSADAYRTKGGSGYGVRLLYSFLKNL